MAHLSDLHFGTEQPNVVAALLSSLQEFAPDRIVVTGDLTQRARPDEYARAAAFAERLPAPALIVPGNHDVAPLHRPIERLLCPFARYRRHFGPEVDFAWHDEELLVIGLCTATPWRIQEGTLSARQLLFLEEAIRRHSAPLRIVATHHPLARLPGDDPTSARLPKRHEQVVSLLERGGAGVLLSGHLHRSFSGIAVPTSANRSSVLAVHASTATSRRLRGHDNAYNQLRLEGGRLQVDVMGREGNFFRTLGRTRYARSASTWHLLPAPGPSANVVH